MVCGYDLLAFDFWQPLIANQKHTVDWKRGYICIDVGQRGSGVF